jgi:GNAT superfamily N-acetyltransferase
VTTPLVVREARPDELDAVGALTVAAYRADGLAYPAYEPYLRDARGRAETAAVLVAVRDGRLVGAGAVATRGGPWAEQAVPGEAVVRMLVADPAERGTGVGAALLSACLDRARSDGCALVRLSSHDGSPAHRLYARAGFVRDPTLDWSPREGVLLRAFALPLAPWCAWCGQALLPQAHPRCRAAAEHEPPRYCARCRRRMVVQVVPTGWTARCSEHGPLTWA